MSEAVVSNCRCPHTNNPVGAVIQRGSPWGPIAGGVDERGSALVSLLPPLRDFRSAHNPSGTVPGWLWQSRKCHARSRLPPETRTTIAGMKLDQCWAMFRHARHLGLPLLIGVVAYLLLFVTPRSVAAQTPTFHVLVLDALDGKPQANVEIQPLCTGPPGNFSKERAMTNDKGIAAISYACGEKQKIEIAVFPPDKKEQCGDDAAMTFDDVSSAGFLSKPDSAGGIWCPAKVSKKLKPVPGQAIIFVKKPTWWQSHVAG